MKRGRITKISLIPARQIPGEAAYYLVICCGILVEYKLHRFLWHLMTGLP